MIYKMQRPILGPRWALGKPLKEGEVVPVLIYNEDRSEEFMLPYNEELAAQFGDEDKIYVKGYRTASGGLIIKEHVKEQPW